MVLFPGEPALVVWASRPRSIRRARRPASTCSGCRCACCRRTFAATPPADITRHNGTRPKRAYADRVGDIIERYAPGFRSNILARTVHSPADLERDNPNLVGGDSLGGSHHLDQNFLFRPAFGWSRYRMPVERLYMVGASTWPGAGTGAGSGFMLAKCSPAPEHRRGRHQFRALSRSRPMMSFCTSVAPS